MICQMTLGSAVAAGGPLKWQSASTVGGEGGSRNSEGDEGGALADHGARMVQRTSVLYSTYGHETAWTASYEPVRQAVLDTDPDSAAADESFL
eukprot:COSAG01_NODE_3103_length_6578_cov_112.775428_5_plen_93_part_00